MDAPKLPRIRGDAPKLDIRGGQVPPRLPVSPIAKIKPATPPPNKGTDKKGK
jgi:hypothetical protein